MRTAADTRSSPRYHEGMDHRTYDAASVEALLDGLRVPHRVVEHEAILTVEEGFRLGVVERIGVPADNIVKNLLLSDTHGGLLLVAAAGATRLDLKAIARGLGTTRLSFAKPEVVAARLGVEPGGVSLFSLLAGSADGVRLVIDDALPALSGEIGFPAGDNTHTVVFAASALPRVAAALRPDAVTMTVGR